MRMMFAKVGTKAWEPCLNPIRYRNNITTYITELTGRTSKKQVVLEHAKPSLDLPAGFAWVAGGLAFALHRPHSCHDSCSGFKVAGSRARGRPIDMNLSN